MPEGPELHLASKFVNTCCKGRIFSGKIVKNPVHKSSDIEFEAPAYTIAAASRGKEMQLILAKLDCGRSGNGDVVVGRKVNRNSKSSTKDEKDNKELNLPETLKILFRFGMSGNFQFTTQDNIHKHSHLRFFTKDKPPMVLSYVDVRRFGRWEVGADWSKDRGPDPMFEYQAFRSNVLKNIQKTAFDQPICEILLNQKFFNGIGNYLRAEILFRLNIPPFEKARTVLEGLSEEPPDVKPMKGGKRKGEEPDLLHLCHAVPLEVIAIGAGGYTADGKASDYSDFMKWLQCYYQDGMANMVDHNGRTIWFSGPPGPMVPKDGKSRSVKSPKKRKKATSSDDVETPVKSKKSEESDNDISQKSRKKTSERKAKIAPKNTGTTKVATSSRKREATSKIRRGDKDKKKGSKNGNTKKGRGDANKPSTVKPKDATSMNGSKKKGKRSTRVVEDKGTEPNKHNTQENRSKRRGNGQHKTSRVASK